jgi:hypothetical protein
MSTRRSFLAGCALITLASLVSLTTASAATPGERAGDATITEGADLSHPLQHGGSATVFALRLTDPAACPGDSAHDGWRVQTFIVPASVNPATLQFDFRQPKTEGGLPLYAASGSPYVQQPTAANSDAGKPGLIVSLPGFSYTRLSPAVLKPGNYRIGVACTLDRVTGRYWDTEITVVAAPEDSPAGLVWRLAGTPASVIVGDHPTNSRVYLWLAAIAVASIGALIVLRRRRRSASTTVRSTPTHRATVSSKEPS